MSSNNSLKAKDINNRLDRIQKDVDRYVVLRNLSKEANFVLKFGSSKHYEALKAKTRAFDSQLWHAQDAKNKKS